MIIIKPILWNKQQHNIYTFYLTNQHKFLPVHIYTKICNFTSPKNISFTKFYILDTAIIRMAYFEQKGFLIVKISIKVFPLWNQIANISCNATRGAESKILSSTCLHNPYMHNPYLANKTAISDLRQSINNRRQMLPCTTPLFIGNIFKKHYNSDGIT